MTSLYVQLVAKTQQMRMRIDDYSERLVTRKELTHQSKASATHSCQNQDNWCVLSLVLSSIEFKL